MGSTSLKDFEKPMSIDHTLKQSHKTAPNILASWKQVL